MKKEFYSDILEDLLKKQIINKKSSILVICGGTYDKNTFFSLGFEDVTISNLDVRMPETDFKPYKWSFQDAENLGFPDDSFDFVIVHLGLHHCHSPHKALLEMYRVARKAILAFENRDSILVRFGKLFNLVEDYEISAVVANDYIFGGVKNTAIPNYIYRWTENEIRKTISSYAPHADTKIKFFYGIRFPEGRSRINKIKLKFIIAKVFFPLIKFVSFIFPGTGNLFAFLVLKPESHDLKPWLKNEGGTLVFKRE